MLTSDELSLLCERVGLSSQAQAILAHIRSSPPSRRVGSGGKNVPVRYSSRKMGLVIQAESRTVEFAGVYVMEHDPLVLEFWDQPNPPITLHYPVKQKNGRTRTVGVLHTPDYFVIRKKPLEREEWKIELGWEEWKTEEELRRFESEESIATCVTSMGSGAAHLEKLLRLRSDFTTASVLLLKFMRLFNATCAFFPTTCAKTAHMFLRRLKRKCSLL